MGVDTHTHMHTHIQISHGPLTCWHRLVIVATPAEPRGAKNTFLFWCKIWAVKNFSKSAGEKFLSGVRGLNIFGQHSDRFSDPFRVFQTISDFRIDLNVLGAVSFCRRAVQTTCARALRVWS